MQLEALLCVELRSAEGVDCETLFGWDSTCVVFLNWEDDSLCNTLEDGETC